MIAQIQVFNIYPVTSYRHAKMLSRGRLISQIRGFLINLILTHCVKFDHSIFVMILNFKLFVLQRK